MLVLCPLALIASAWLGGVSQAQSQFDRVYGLKGAPVQGTITAMKPTEVTLDMAGVPRTFPVNEIKSIAFGEEPSELANARNAVLQRNYNVALEELRKLTAESLTRDYMRQDAEFYRAYCMAHQAMSEGGDKTAAENALKAFAGRAPGSYHFFTAAEVLGELAASAGKYSDAARYYGAVAAKAPWPDYQMRANNAVGRALLGEKDYAAALQKFDAVIATDLSTTEGARQKQFAMIGKAVCQANTGKPDDGIKLLIDIIAKNDAQDGELFAKVYNALGDCYLKANRPKDALEAFLHTDILFYANADAHAEALYHLSKLWPEMNKSDRGVAARNTLRERYAGSVWSTLQ
jgi:tetratricopeptide (TPR) repeat protein